MTKLDEILRDCGYPPANPANSANPRSAGGEKFAGLAELATPSASNTPPAVRFSAADTAEFERRGAASAAALHRHPKVQGLLHTRAVRDPATGGPLVAVVTARRWPDGRITVAEIAVAPEVWARDQHQFSFYLTAQVQPA